MLFNLLNNGQLLPHFVQLRKYNPGNALHEKGLHRHNGNGPLVCSQERRAAMVRRINRLSTARCVPRFPDMPLHEKGS